MSFQRWIAENDSVLDWTPYRYSSPTAGRVLLVFNAALQVTLLAVFMVGVVTNGKEIFHYSRLVIPVLMGALVWLHVKLVHGARKMFALREFRAMADDGRNPVIYLRGFAVDNQTIAKDPVGASPERYLSWSVEQVVMDAIRSHGPVMALAEPGAGIKVGAGRLFAKDGQWQSVVDKLIESSTVMLLRVGTSPGIRWELQTALRPENRHKAVLLLVDEMGYPLGRRPYSYYRELIQEWTGFTLPEKGWNSWYLYFDNHGNPQTVDANDVSDLQSEIADATEQLVKRSPILNRWHREAPRSAVFDPYMATDYKWLRLAPLVTIGGAAAWLYLGT